MVRKTVVMACSALLTLFLFGCATQPVAHYEFAAVQPVGSPGPGYGVVVDNLLIVADVSRSMRECDKIGVEKAFLSSFNSAIPQELNEAGLRTFGKSAYDATVLVSPLQPYQRTTLAGVIGELKAGCGSTPLASALRMAPEDLANAQGNIAVLVVSDGENLSEDPIPQVLALKEIYGGRICVHTVHVGQSEQGRNILNQVAGHSLCGIAASAADLQSEEAMRKFVTDVFYGQVAMPAPPPAPVDSDGDGVPDNLDKCPNTPAGVAVDKNGCPLDSDGDGVPDYLDKCPDTPAGVQVDKNGCPLDSDGDGVPDYKDRCPDTPKGATVNEFGCWSIQGITFEYNKSNVLPEFYGLLDQNARVLQMNPSMKILIEGYTDSVGSEAYNQALSERRAEAVKQYFVSKGIDASRIQIKGRGESNPIASNETPEGRAKNRRIEIKILSK